MCHRQHTLNTESKYKYKYARTYVYMLPPRCSLSRELPGQVICPGSSLDKSFVPGAPGTISEESPRSVAHKTPPAELPAPQELLHPASDVKPALSSTPLAILDHTDRSARLSAGTSACGAASVGRVASANGANGAVLWKIPPPRGTMAMAPMICCSSYTGARGEQPRGPPAWAHAQAGPRLTMRRWFGGEAVNGGGGGGGRCSCSGSRCCCSST